VIDIMRTHPMIIIGGILQHNPFFVPPEEFLREVASGGPGGRRTPDNSGLTWTCDRKIPPER